MGDSDLGRAADRLRSTLRAAAADGFVGVTAPGLAARLEQEVTELARRLPEADRAPWRDLYRRLAQFERLGVHDRAAWVAEAMRCSCALPVATTRPRARRDDPLLRLPGVGPKVAERLRAAGISCLRDLARLVPRGYDDYRGTADPGSFVEGAEVGIEGTVRAFRQGRIRGGRFMATCEVDVSGNVVLLRWFHPMRGLSARLSPGTRVRAHGRVRRHGGRWSMAHPVLRAPGEAGGIVPRYPEVPGVGPDRLAKLCRAAVDLLDAEEEVSKVPACVADRVGLEPAADALRYLHAPPPDLSDEALSALRAGRSPAHRSLLFEDLFVVQLALARRRARVLRRGAAVVACTDGPDLEMVRAAVPFEPTGAQVRVLHEIAADLASGRPMMRLLQGDVGAGKTFVAFAAAAWVAAAGAQTAIMAPTELLARQHARTLRPWCERAGLRLATVTGRMGRAERASVLALVASGRIDVVVGTHALLTESVVFRELGLAVVDEQHRFGVEQRARLREKGAAAHLLVMTATPIPRTVALAVYGELDLSVLDELPPGRTPTRTRTFAGARGLAAARKALCEAVRAGGRAFVVCPLVEASDAVAATNVEDAAAAYAAFVGEARVGRIHGRMAPDERERVMADFRDGRIDVLVATTVVEVGVDVPEATVMLVEHAERFGLAQLHQLRGRVGRGERPGLCLLHTDAPVGSDAARRLSVLARTNDGFEVAEADLELRGPGEVFGRRQAGAAGTFGGLLGALSLSLVEDARREARALLEASPDLADHPALRAEVERFEALGAARGGEAG
ncbi:MAG: ATP-dependent DNA helicase RecG [Deltaproteobacteria bacterium]|nr:MAG: ATP-dependent DNA helicase RecG [Deltaproteobacteria bacterium]